ncbi:hypothetical protein ASZ90_004601 [hydrocarbon metagenome]|uniref:Uncharacterized protein n=1 Tax=hydrocarbon metagenome TaxID=938273 RepID=A0A0W8FXE9_9ZZZZ
MTAKRYDKAKSKLLKDAADEIARNFETNQNFFPHYLERNRDQRDSFKELLIITNTLLISQWSENHTIHLINLFDFYFFTLENYPRFFNESINALSSVYPFVLLQDREPDYPNTDRKRIWRINKGPGLTVIPESENQFITKIHDSTKTKEKENFDKIEQQLKRLLLLYHYVKGMREKDFANIELNMNRIKEFENFFLKFRDSINKQREKSGKNKITDDEIFQLMEKQGLGKEETIIYRIKRVRETGSKKTVNTQTKKDAEVGLRIFDEIMEMIEANIHPTKILNRLKKKNNYNPELIEFAIAAIDGLVNKDK